MSYDGFISYSHAADDLLAPRLQSGLQRFAKPWWKRRALRVFRDESSLSANPHLWESITEALDTSGWFVLLLSPDAAESEWVNQEISYWVEHKDPSRILPVVTAGEFGWADGDVTGDAVPDALRGVFTSEPRWVDLRFAKGEEQLDLQDPRFADAIADVASAMRGVAKDELAGEEVRQHKRTVRTAWAAGFLLMALTIATSWVGVTSAGNARAAEASRLATASVNVLDDDPELSLLLALSSLRSDPELSLDQRRALHAAIDRARSIGTIEQDMERAWTAVGWPSPDGTMVLVGGDARAPLSMYENVDGEWVHLWTSELIGPDWQRYGAFTTDGEHVVIHGLWNAGWGDVPDEPPNPSEGGAYVLDARSGDLVHKLDEPPCSTAWYAPDLVGTVGETVVGFCSDEEGGWWRSDVATGEVTYFHSSGPVFWALQDLDGGRVLFEDDKGFWWFDDSTGEVTGIQPEGTVALPGGVVVTPTGLLFDGRSLSDPVTGETLVELEETAGFDGCSAPVLGVSLDGDLLLLGCETGEVRVFDQATGSELYRLLGHQGGASFAFPAIEAEVAVSGSADGTVKVWDLSRRAEVRLVDIGGGYKADASLDLVDATAAAVVYPNEVDSPFSGVTSNMTRAAVGELVVFDAESGDVQHRVPDVGGKVARLSPDGRSVAVQAAGTDGLGSVVILDLGSGELIELPGLCPWVVGEPGECEDGIAGDVTDLAWSSDGSRLAAALGTSQRLLVWDVDSEDIVFESDRLGEQAWVALSAVAFNADGSTLAASSKHGMWIFDAATWDLRKRIHHPGRPSWVMAFTPDGSELITAQAHSGDVVVYDTRTWTERRFQGGVGQTRDMDLASDASMVALSSNDGTIHVLNVETGDLVDMISLDGRDITNIEFANGDRHLLITSSTGPVEVLTLEPDELIDVARTRVFRSFTAEECATYEIDPCPTLGELRDR